MTLRIIINYQLFYLGGYKLKLIKMIQSELDLIKGKMIADYAKDKIKMGIEFSIPFFCKKISVKIIRNLKGNQKLVVRNQEWKKIN